MLSESKLTFYQKIVYTRAYSSVICSAEGFANATFSYLEKALHGKIFIKKVNAVAVGGEYGGIDEKRFLC